MIPHPQTHGPEYADLFFLVEKPGLEVASLGGIAEDAAEDELVEQVDEV